MGCLLETALQFSTFTFIPILVNQIEPAIQYNFVTKTKLGLSFSGIAFGPGNMWPLIGYRTGGNQSCKPSCRILPPRIDIFYHMQVIFLFGTAQSSPPPCVPVQLEVDDHSGL